MFLFRLCNLSSALLKTAANFPCTNTISKHHQQSEARNENASLSSEPGSLLSTVLRHDPEAFDYISPGPVKECGWRNLSSEKRSSQENSHGGIQSHSISKGASSNFPEGISLNTQTPVSARKSRMIRKDKTSEVVDKGKSEALDHPDGTVAGFCELLDDYLERAEIPGEDEGEEEGTWLPLFDIKLLGNEIASAHSRNTLHLVPVETIVRLLGLLDRHIRRGHDMTVDEEYDVDSDNFCIVMSALESVHIALMIMTHQHMPKQVYSEEIIDRIINFSRHQIVQSVFTAYDPSYRRIYKGRETESYRGDEGEDDDDDEYGSVKEGCRKGKVVKARKLSLLKVSSTVSTVLQKLCSILGLLKELLLVERLLDSSVLQLIKTSLATLTIDNIQLLQLKAIGVVCAVFSSYLQHRTIIMDEIIQLLWKLPSSKRNLRSYHLPDDDQKQIQMLTALLIHVVQCSVSLPELPEGGSTTPDIADQSSSPAKCFEPATEACMYFWGTVLQRWTSSKAHDGADIKGVVENLVLDLLTTLNVPEYPAAGLLLHVCVSLFENAGLKSKDAVVRGMAMDLLGQIAARLKHDAVVCSNDKLWILQELYDDKSEGFGLQKEKCAVCLEGKGVKFMICCDGCKRSFHGDCIGATEQDILGRGSLCHCCLSRKQLSFLGANLKMHSENRESNLKSNAKQTAEVSPRAGVDVIRQINPEELRKSCCFFGA